LEIKPPLRASFSIKGRSSTHELTRENSARAT
jgi:hypothetical protein